MDALAPAIDPDDDNRAVVQACLDDAAERGGGTVVLPNGRCPVSAPLELRDNVTLQGTGMITTILCATGSASGPLLVADALLRGATVEDLTLAGDAPIDLDAATPVAPSDTGLRATAAIDLRAGASFAFLRRLRLVDLVTGALRIGGGPIDHVYLEQIVVEGCAGDGIVVAPREGCDAVFLTEISVRSFGRAGPPAAGVRLGGRAFISQLHVQPVEVGASGLALDAGSDHTVASNLFFGVSGGEATTIEPGLVGIEIEAALTRDLLDEQLARVFP